MSPWQDGDFLTPTALNTKSPSGFMASTISAAAFSGATNEAKITAAIAQAALLPQTAGNLAQVWIPASMLPYNASLVTFNPSVRMVREGQTNFNHWDVKAYGAAGDDVTDDATAIQAASNGCDASAGGIVHFPNGTYIVGTGLLIGNRVRWLGTGEGGRDDIIPARNASAIRAKSTFNGAYLVTNKVTPQEFIWIEKLQIDGNAGNGAVCTDLVKLNQVFVNSCFRDVLLTNFSGVGLHVTGLTNGVYTGPMLFDNVWVIGTGVQPGSTGHNIVVDSDCWNIWFNNLTSENCASGKSLLRIDGSASSATSKGHRISNFHGEWNGALTNCIGIELINCTETIVDGATFFVSGTSTSATLVKMTTANRNNSVRGLALHTAIATTMLNDVVSGKSFSSSVNSGIAQYQQGCLTVADTNGVMNFGGAGGGSTLRLVHNGGDGRMALFGSNDVVGVFRASAYPCEVLTPTYGPSITFQPDQGELVAITVTNNTAFTINNPNGINVAGQTLILGIFNNSGGAMGVITFGAAFKLAGAFTNPGNGNWRFLHFKLTAGAWREVSRSPADVPN